MSSDVSNKLTNKSVRLQTKGQGREIHTFGDRGSGGRPSPFPLKGCCNLHFTQLLIVTIYFLLAGVTPPSFGSCWDNFKSLGIVLATLVVGKTIVDAIFIPKGIKEKVICFQCLKHDQLFTRVERNPDGIPFMGRRCAFVS